jgi:hypothetical protein
MIPRRAAPVATVVLLLTWSAVGKAASTWQPPQPLDPAPATVSLPFADSSSPQFPSGDDLLLAASSSNASDAGWLHPQADGSSAMTIAAAPRSQPFSLGAAVSPAYQGIVDERFASNARGDLAWAYAAPVPGDPTTTAIEVGTLPAGSGPRPVTRLQEAQTFGGPVVVRVAVGADGTVAVAWIGARMQVWAAVARRLQAFSRPVRLTAQRHEAGDQLDLSVVVDPTGTAFVGWRDVLSGGSRGTMDVAAGTAGGFAAARRLSPAGEDARGPLVSATNPAGVVLFAWRVSAAVRPPGGNFGPTERHGLYYPQRAALDPDGVAYLAGPDQGSDHSLLVAARPVNGRFLAATRIYVSGDNSYSFDPARATPPRFDLLAPARGAGVLVATGFRPGRPVPITVRLIAPDGTPGAPTVAAAPHDSVSAVAAAVQPSGAAVLVFATGVSVNTATPFAQIGQINLRAPETGRFELVRPGARSLRYRVRGLRRFGVLGGTGIVPNHSEIDGKGRGLSMTVERADRHETVTVSGGNFIVSLASAANPSTDMRLSGGPACKASARSRAGQSSRAPAARLAASARRFLNARGHGRFRTRGRYAAASVRGTSWDTIDSCAATVVVVRRGVVAVKDLVRKRVVLVRAGHSYTARRR